jgi:hypothetical protein
MRLLMGAILLIGPAVAFCQGTSQTEVNSPFDSIKITHISATGNPQTGSVKVTMQVRSDFHKLASLSFSGGAFDDFGVTDEQGVKYKYFSYSGPAGTNNGANRGYAPIKDLQLNGKKVSVLISVQDTFSAGKTATLSFQLQQVNKSVASLKEIHILCHLMLDFMNAGQKQFFIKNLPVQWQKGKDVATGSKQPAISSNGTVGTVPGELLRTTP